MLGKLFGWLRPRPPAQIPEALWQRTLASTPFLAALNTSEQGRLRTLAERFLAEKEFSTAGGLVLTDAMCVAIAAQGCLPVLELGLSSYAGWVGIVVYPDEFVVPRQTMDDHGIVHEYDDVIAGESWQGGPLLVSWRDVKMAGEGYNVVIHEFTHKLDMLDGETDGVPALHSGITRTEWETTLFAAYDHFCTRIDNGEETWIDPYAAEHPAEFFAVLSECFFDAPDVVTAEYPELYRLLSRYYRQDPLSRHPAPTAHPCPPAPRASRFS